MTDENRIDDPLSPQDFPPELRDFLRKMSLRGPVVDQATGERVAEDGHLVGDDAFPTITCPVCESVSYNPHDIAHGYCGYCHAFTSTPKGQPGD